MFISRVICPNLH